jgi:hypothetical protein
VQRFVLGVITAVCVFPVCAFGSIGYSNTTTDTLTDISYLVNGFSQIGDEITLSTPDFVATSATVQYYSDGSAGIFDATLQLFNVGSPVGTQIGSNFVVTRISVAGDPGGDEVNVTFSLPNLLVPENLIFTVSIGNQSNGVFIDGLELYDPPTIGYSDPTFAIANSGSGLTTISTIDNLSFELDGTAAPEPATAATGGTALLILVFLMVRRRSMDAK